MIRHQRTMTWRSLWLLTLAAGMAHAEDVTITGQARWENQVRVTGTVRVAPGATLTIRPGTTVTFVRAAEGQNGLVVAGRLAAAGTPKDPITFTSAEGPGNGGYLRGEKDAALRLEHCPLTALGGQPPLHPACSAADINGDTPGQGVSLAHTRLRDCWGGVSLKNVQAAVIADCDFGPLRGGGCVVLNDCRYAVVRDCRLHAEQGAEGSVGVGLHVSSECEVIGCDLAGNWLGVYGTWATANILERNVFHGNSEGVRWWKSRANQVANCTVTRNSGDGVRLVGGGEAYPGNSVRNCLLVANGGYGLQDTEGLSGFALSHNNVFGNALGDYQNCEAGPDSRSVDPLFRDPDQGNFQLQANSPCLDAGDPAGQDLGAYDQGQPASASAAVRPQLLALRNPGFEAAGDGQPTFWQTGADPSGEMSVGVDETVAHGGRSSLRLRIEGAPAADRPVRHCGFGQSIRVKPGRYYLVTCWMKGQGARGWPGARIFSEFLGEMQSGPDHTGDYDWKEVSVCVYSKTARTIPISGYAYLHSGTVWFDDLAVREISAAEVGDWTPRPETAWRPSPADRQRGYVLFTRPTTERIYHTAVPEPGERLDGLSLAAARDQTAAANLLIRSLDRLEALRLAPGELTSGQHRLTADQIAWRVVEPYRYLLDSYRWISVPLFLRNRGSFALPANHTAQLYVTVKVPPGTPPGAYRGKLTVSVQGHPATALPVALEVLPLTLPRPEACFFQYYSSSYIHPAYDGPEFQRRYMENMRDHGFTGVTIYNHCEFPDGQGGWTVDVERRADGDPLSLADSMKLAQDTGLLDGRQPLVYLNSYAGSEHPEWRHDFGGLLGGQKSLRALEAERQRRGWPEFLYYVVDEPGDETRNAAAREIFDRTYRDQPVRTVTAIGRQGMDTVGDLYNVWIAAWGDVSDGLIQEARERGRELWTYQCWSMAQLPEMARYFAGFWSDRCGVRGNGDWVYISTANSRQGRIYPRLDTDGQYVHTDNWIFGYVLPGPNGPIDTIGLELRREGIDDYRVLQLLDNLLARAAGLATPRARAAVTEARMVRQFIRQRFHSDAFADMSSGHIWFHDYRPQPELKLTDYDALRGAALRQCLALTAACEGQ